MDRVLVTGGAKRIGQAICRDLARDHEVVVHANTSMADAEALAKELGGTTVQADLSDPAQVEGLLERVGPVAHVVNNASAFPRTTLAQATYEDLDQMMRLHAWAPLALARGAAATGAQSIVNILDTRVVSHDPQHFPYLTSKQALANLTRTLAKELAPMRVNGVAPGPILEPNDGSGDDLEAAVDATALKRAGTPAEVAHAVRYCIEAQYVTGQILFVDGGRHL